MLKDFILEKIKSAIVETEPFSHIVIPDFLPESFIKDFSNLPNYHDIDENVYFQDLKHSKKSIADNNPDKNNYKSLLDTYDKFNDFDKICKEDNELKNVIFEKFSNELIYRNIENLIVEYIQIQTAKEFEKFVYEKSEE